MTTNIHDVLNEIVKRFESGDIPEALAYSTFPIPNTPSTEWSFLNRTLMFLAGTADARGFRQWQAVGRKVKKGSKAFYILVPRVMKRSEEEASDAHDELVVGFLARPVFRLEDTEGRALDYAIPTLPDLPLLSKAEEWGISVKAIPGNYKYYGYYSVATQEIALASEEESVFLHELAHAAHARVLRALGSTESAHHCPEWRSEIVAELSAAALCRIVGKSSKFLGTSFQYIRHYAEKAKLTPAKACLKVLKEVESVLKLILAPPKPSEKPVMPLISAAEAIIAVPKPRLPGHFHRQSSRHP